MFRWLRFVLPPFLLLMVLASLKPHTVHAQGMLPIRVTTAVMQISPSNGTGQPHTLQFNNVPSPRLNVLQNAAWIQQLFARVNATQPIYRDQPQTLGRRTMGAFRAWQCVGLTLCKPLHPPEGRGGSPMQQGDSPFTYVDEATGSIASVDQFGNVTISDANGQPLLEFALFENYFGDWLVQTEGEDDSVYRESFDGYSVEIDPEGDDCIVSTGDEEFPLYVDEDGFLIYEDEDGYWIAFEQGDDGVLYSDDSEGVFGEFYPGGEYAYFDEDGNLIDEGEIDNPTLEEREDELGFDLIDPDSAFYDDSAFDDSAFDDDFSAGDDSDDPNNDGDNADADDGDAGDGGGTDADNGSADDGGGADDTSDGGDDTGGGGTDDAGDGTDGADDSGG